MFLNANSSTLNKVFPRLKSSVVIPRSSKKLSVFACEMLERSRSRLKNMMKAQTMMRTSIFLMTRYKGRLNQIGGTDHK